MGRLGTYLTGLAIDGFISGSSQLEAALRFDLTFAEVEAEILELGFWPARYQRNRQSITCEGQLDLLRNTAAVIGCGGLGGYVIEELARLGVGRIVAIDPDVFEEHNLNRQLLATLGNLGEYKVTAAARRVRGINPVVVLVPHRTAFSAENGRELLAGATVVVDGLDNIATRVELIGICGELGIPLVHGAIAGWYGQVATQVTGDGISRLLSCAEAGGRGAETLLGNPPFTPAVVASLQVAEACKAILAQGKTASGRMQTLNRLEMEFEEIRL